MKRLTFALTLALLLQLASDAFAADGKAFSELSADVQAKLRASVAPPPPAGRTGSYSTPMYYLMRKGYTYHGDWDRDPNNRPHPPMQGQPLSPDYGTWSFDRARPDFQEAMIKDWVELGMNVSHLNIYPIDGSLELSSDYVEAIRNFVNLSNKHGLRVGVRLDALQDWWQIHPANPENRIDEYLVWVKQVAEIMKGKTLYYVVGDELSIGKSHLIPAGQEWSVEQYMDYFGRVSRTIKQVDPDVKVSMFAISYGHYALVPQFLKAGYAEVGDAITVNSNDMDGTRALFDEVRKVKPDMMFLSNGVGYEACALAQPQYPVGTPYKQHPTEESHGAAIAKMMFSWWELGASTAPYYVSLRNWVLDGNVYPYWYGFFGFEDYVVEDDTLIVKRYPGWHAFHTVAHTFYNRDEFAEPEFDVKPASALPTMFRVFEHRVENGSELVMMLWNDAGEADTEIKVASGDYRFPVRINLFDLNDWQDVAHEKAGDGSVLRLKVGPEPTIIRMFRQN